MTTITNSLRVEGADLSRVREAAYRAYMLEGGWVESPYTAWSAEDLEWLAGMDDASGADAVDAGLPERRHLHARPDPQLDLL